MAETRTVMFRTSGVEGDTELIREYVLDAMDRLEGAPGCEGIAFTPVGRKAHLEEMEVEGGVLLRIAGSDVESVIEGERERWDALVDEGIAEGWKVPDIDRDSTDGTDGGSGRELYRRLDFLAAELSKLVYEEFDRPPDPVDEYPEEERTPVPRVGWWNLLHFLTINQNYRYEDEIDALAENLRFALRNIARFDDHRRAERKADEVIESLEAVRGELDQLEFPGE